MFVGAQIDCQMGRVAWDYEIVLRVVLGERVLEEHEVRVAWNDIDEPRRLGLLCLYCSQILIQTDRWRRRSDRAIEEALQAARARFGLPPASGFVTPPSGASRK